MDTIEANLDLASVLEQQGDLTGSLALYEASHAEQFGNVDHLLSEVSRAGPVRPCRRSDGQYPPAR
jgi:hypothetical protein